MENLIRISRQQPFLRKRRNQSHYMRSWLLVMEKNTNNTFTLGYVLPQQIRAKKNADLILKKHRGKITFWVWLKLFDFDGDFSF